MEGGKKTRGRQKIVLRIMENASERQVTFSKRKSGVIKKASEMVIRCGADVGFVVFSESGKSFSYGSPSIDSVANRILPNLQNQIQNKNSIADAIIEADRKARIEDMTRVYAELNNKLEDEIRRAKRLQQAGGARATRDQGIPGWWEQPVEGQNMEGLKFMYNKLAHVHNDIVSYLSSTASVGASSSNGGVGMPLMYPPGFNNGSSSHH